MLSVVSFGIAIVSLSLVASLSLWFMWRLIQNQSRQIQTLTNLATSKDLMTFHQLQATTNQSPQSVELEPVNPLNDAAVAHRLAEDYKRSGLDPNYAYNQDEPSFSDEFGLNL